MMNQIKQKRIGLVAHDNQKKDLVKWIDRNSEMLSAHKLICTGTTGSLVLKMLQKKHPGISIDVTLLKSGPLGGDQQLGAMLSNQEIDFLVFLTDPMTPQPHDVDVKALLRMAVIYNVLTACNLSTADFIVTSPLFNSDYVPVVQDFSHYIARNCVIED